MFTKAAVTDRTDLGARGHDVALLVHEEFGYGFTQVMTRVPSTYIYAELTLIVLSKHLLRSCTH